MNQPSATPPLVPIDSSPKSMQNQIAEMKDEILKCLDGDSTVSFNINNVLEHLRKAEEAAGTGGSESWYELANAKFLFYGKDATCFSDLPDVDTKVLRNELYRTWQEILQVQRQHTHINPVNAADWLICGEKALEKDKPEKARTMYCIVRARFSLAKALECSRSNIWGLIAVLLECAYLFAIPIAVISYSAINKIPITDMGIRSFGEAITILNVPRYVFFWGFLGGVSWCIYRAAYWAKRRLFDRYYFVWYVTHPFISAVLGGATSLLFIGGINSLSAGFSVNSQTGSALLSLISFFAGFSTNAIWKQLDNAASKIFGRKIGRKNNPHEIAGRVRIDSHLKFQD